MAAPQYSYPPGVFAAFVRDLLLLRKRDFRKDAQACIANIHPPLKIIDQENIPQSGPCVITVRLPIIMPVYNEATTLEAAVRSAFRRCRAQYRHQCVHALPP